MDAAGWEDRLATVWADPRFDDDEAGLREAVDALVAELPPDDPRAPFERAGAYDATGSPELAVPLYRAALSAGLSGDRRRECCIQLASSLRNLGQAGEAVAILEAELTARSDDLDDAVRAFLALALLDAGRSREAVATALTALAPHLTRYRRSVTAYAAELAR